MKRRPVRITVLLLFVTAVAVAGYRVLRLQQQVRADRAAAAAFDWTAADALVSVSDLRAAQQAYVAQGQEGPFWITKVESTHATVLDGLARLTLLAASGEAIESLGAAELVLSEFSKMDERVVEYTGNGQRLMASDLIFTEGQEMTAAAIEHVRTARAQEQRVRAASVDQRLRDQGFSILGAAGIGLLALLLLLPVDPVFGRPAGARSTRGRAVLTADRPLGLPNSPDDRTRPAAPPGASAMPAASLAAVADLCSDFSKVTDVDALPSLLRRTSGLLNGAGIVIWLADPTGAQLRPVLVHGYRAETLRQLGAIPTDADNATATAFREGTPEVVKATPDTQGALVVPIFAGPACVGVVATEVKHGEESQTELRSVAEIVAAQFAGLVTSPARAQAAHDVRRKRSG